MTKYYENYERAPNSFLELIAEYTEIPRENIIEARFTGLEDEAIIEFQRTDYFSPSLKNFLQLGILFEVAAEDVFVDQTDEEGVIAVTLVNAPGSFWDYREKIPEQAAEKPCDLFEAVGRGYEEGHEKGFFEGLEEGHEAGFNDGWQQGYDAACDENELAAEEQEELESDRAEAAYAAGYREAIERMRAACVVLGDELMNLGPSTEGDIELGNV